MFMNDISYLTAYSLAHYDEVEDVADCNLTYKQTGKYYNNDTSGKRYIKSFQVFNSYQSIRKLIGTMPLT